MEVQGFPNYLIYPDGRVWSKNSNKFMKYSKTGGYLFISLRNGGKRITKYIHRLIAEHYIPNPENKKEVDHMNRDTLDNRIENLRWVSPQENCENRGLRNDNTSGHTNIYWVKSRKIWSFRVRGRHNKVGYFHSKTDAICYKFIFNLMSACNIRWRTSSSSYS